MHGRRQHAGGRLSTAVPAAGPSRGNPRVALKYIFTSPTRAFQEIAAGASWWWGWLATTVLMLIAQILQHPYIALYMSEQFGVTDPTPEFASKIRIAEIVLAACVPLLLMGIFAAGAAIFLLALWIAGISTQFTRIMRAMAYTGVIAPGLQQIVQGIAVQLKHRAGNLLTTADEPRIGLDLLGGEGRVKAVLAGFDIFSIWSTVVLGLGLIVLTRRKASQVVPPVIAAGIVWLIVTALLNGN